MELNNFRKLGSQSVGIDLYQRANMRIGKIASSADDGMDNQFQNCQILEPNFDYPNWKKISKFFNFSIWTIPKTSNLENSENFNLIFAI